MQKKVGQWTLDETKNKYKMDSKYKNIRAKIFLCVA